MYKRQEENISRVSGFSINEHNSDVNKVTFWDEETSGFFYRLFFELWFYNTETSSFEFHDRSVGLQLNMTSSS